MAKQEVPDWVRKMRERQTQQLIEEGFIFADEYRTLHLTEKGKCRAAARLDKLPPGDEILLEVAFCEAHNLALRLD